MAVVGAGYIAVEMAGIMHALGTPTDLFFRGETILRRGFDPWIVETLMDEIKAHGPAMHPKCTPKEITKDAADGTYTLHTTCGKELKGYDCVLMAIGRRPVTNLLNLDAVGVATDKDGFIQVDKFENSSVDGVLDLGLILTISPAFLGVAPASHRPAHLVSTSMTC